MCVGVCVGMCALSTRVTYYNDNDMRPPPARHTPTRTQMNECQHGFGPCTGLTVSVGVIDQAQALEPCCSWGARIHNQTMTCIAL